ncbi:hypothetical protein EVAR_98969_1 [Eumeta japonica]|uniref:Uncharacterized protein n=1 Tax=Eumeta variegata TaxID=151549 RepID=A0A4C1YMQ2_EUMVA|nr:hypothetical protein EVAR_98969_1 [Eumeta japonica]
MAARCLVTAIDRRLTRRRRPRRPRSPTLSWISPAHLIFIYASESWIWQKKNESRISAVEMRSLRSMCGMSHKDRCRNSDVRERCGLKEDVVARAERGMLRWFGHLERVNESRLTKQIYRVNVCDGKIAKSLSRKSYAAYIGGIFKKAKTLAPETDELA